MKKIFKNGKVFLVNSVLHDRLKKLKLLEKKSKYDPNQGTFSFMKEISINNETLNSIFNNDILKYAYIVNEYISRDIQDYLSKTLFNTIKTHQNIKSIFKNLNNGYATLIKINKIMENWYYSLSLYPDISCEQYRSLLYQNYCNKINEDEIIVNKINYLANDLKSIFNEKLKSDAIEKLKLDVIENFSKSTIENIKIIANIIFERVRTYPLLTVAKEVDDISNANVYYVPEIKFAEYTPDKKKEILHNLENNESNNVKNNTQYRAFGEYCIISQKFLDNNKEAVIAKFIEIIEKNIKNAYENKINVLEKLNNDEANKEKKLNDVNNEANKENDETNIEDIGDLITKLSKQISNEKEQNYIDYLIVNVFANYYNKIEDIESKEKIESINELFNKSINEYVKINESTEEIINTTPLNNNWISDIINDEEIISEINNYNRYKNNPPLNSTEKISKKSNSYNRPFLNIINKIIQTTLKNSNIEESTFIKIKNKSLILNEEEQKKENDKKSKETSEIDNFILVFKYINSILNNLNSNIKEDFNKINVNMDKIYKNYTEKKYTNEKYIEELSKIGEDIYNSIYNCNYTYPYYKIGYIIDKIFYNKLSVILNKEELEKIKKTYKYDDFDKIKGKTIQLDDVQKYGEVYDKIIENTKKIDVIRNVFLKRLKDVSKGNIYVKWVDYIVSDNISGVYEDIKKTLILDTDNSSKSLNNGKMEFIKNAFAYAALQSGIERHKEPQEKDTEAFSTKNPKDLRVEDIIEKIAEENNNKVITAEKVSRLGFTFIPMDSSDDYAFLTMLTKDVLIEKYYDMKIDYYATKLMNYKFITVIDKGEKEVIGFIYYASYASFIDKIKRFLSNNLNKISNIFSKNKGRKYI